MFTLKIRTENEAFRDPFTGDFDEYAKAREVLRILKDAVEDFEQNLLWGSITEFKNLRDVNGNTVGEFRLK